MHATTLTLTLAALAALAALTSGCSIHVHSGAGRANSYDHHYSARIGSGPEAPRWRASAPGAAPAAPAAHGQARKQHAPPGGPAQAPQLREAGDATAPAAHLPRKDGGPTLISGRAVTDASSSTLERPRVVLHRPTQGVSGRSTSSHTIGTVPSVRTVRTVQPNKTSDNRQLRPAPRDGRGSNTPSVRSPMLQQSPREALARPGASTKPTQRGLPRDGRAAQRANPPHRKRDAQPAGPSNDE